VAVGEIGLDHFVPGLDRAPAALLHRAAEAGARRRAAGDPARAPLGRRAAGRAAAVPVAGGIAHAFNGSAVQAGQFVDRGFGWASAAR
jgi:TatD DNase family protein